MYPGSGSIEEQMTPVSCAPVTEFDLAQSNWFNCLVGTIVSGISLPNPKVGKYSLLLTHDENGPHTMTNWPSNILWRDEAYDTGSAASSVDVVTLFYDGSNFLADFIRGFH